MPPGKKLEISFPHFHVDYCHAAGVTLYDGQKLEKNKVETYCGFDNPDTFTSSGNEVQIQVSGTKRIKRKAKLLSLSLL